MESVCSQLGNARATIALCFFFQFFLLSPHMFAQQLAFPTAQGAGAYSTGGRGGTVSIVTNLNDNGPGSLRSFSRVSNTTIVFNVSGVINLKSPLRFYGHDVTIAGQTAPEGGITIEGARVVFEFNRNLICRYIRFRGGHYEEFDTVEGFELTNAIFDHCSISFGLDECISISANAGADFGKGVTLQNSLLAESAKGSIMRGEGEPGNFGGLSMIGNVYYNITHRFPNLWGNIRFDVINNYVHNARWRLMRGIEGYRLNQIGNLYDFGDNKDVTIYDSTMNFHGCTEGNETPSIYTNGNVILGVQSVSNIQTVTSTIEEVNADNTLSWKYFHDNSRCGGFGAKNRGDQLESNFFASRQYPILGKSPTIHKAADLKDILVPSVGASKRLNGDGTVSDNNDALDSEWKRNIMEGNYIPAMDQNKYATPAIPSVSRPTGYDSDNDGMADEWEMLMFGTLSHDGTKDSNGNGYTDLEEFLNQVDIREAATVPVERIDVAPKTARLALKETLQLTSTYVPVNTTDKNGTWSSSNPAIATVDEKGLVTPVSIGDGPVSVGDVVITYTAADGRTKGSTLVTVFKPPVLVYAGVDQVICNGGSTTFTATGASRYEWNTGSRNASITVAPSTSRAYTVTGYDSSGKYSDTAIVYLTVLPRNSKVDAGANVTIYAGESTTLKATGANAYRWSSGETTASVTVSPAKTTTYTVTGTTNGCGDSTDTVTVTVIDRLGVNASAGIDQQICIGSSTTLTATGGSTYLWSTGETTASITVSPHETTTYTVTAFDSTGENSDNDEVRVTVNPLPKVNAGSDVTINSGETVTLTASGAESYRWNTGATTQSIKVSPTSTTTYTVVGTTNGCEASDDVTVFSVEASVKANAGGDTEICSGSSVTLTASGGSTYLWSTGATSASITVSPNATETYSVTAYGNTEGNSDTDEVMVTVKPLPIVNAGSDITIEQGESAVLTATGATSYKWSNGMEGSSITVNPSSTRAYTVTGTNESGCEAKDTVRVVVLGTVEVIADAGKDQQICIGSSATLTATGGATYLWSTGETTASITVNPNSTTTYSVTAYDATGNFSDTDDVIVTVNPLPVVSGGKNVTIYSGESTVLSATGANSYKWSTGDTGASVTVSPTTTQTYTVTGRSNGCEDTSTVSVVVLPAVEVIADAGKNQQICKGSSATLTATGGATYLWSTGETTASISVSPNSTTKYTVTVYDDTGKFSDTDDVMVTVNPLPVINAGKNVTINSGESTILTATGATSYKWNTGAVGNKITVRPTVTTTYTVTGVSNGCEAVSTVTVTVKTPQKVVASAGKDQDICEGGSVKLTATGGETYLWSTGAKTPSITVSPKSTAKYSVTAYVGDVSAKAEVVVNVTANPKVKIANGSETSLLKGERVTLSASGAKTYKWNNGAVQPNITVIPNSTQTYKVTGFNDKCAAERSVKVNVLEKVVASAGKDVTIYRNEKTVLTATGPKGSEYLWSTGETTKSITVSPEESTVYSVMVYHALDSDTANVTVNVIDLVDEDILDDSTNLKFLIHPNPTNGELHVKVSGLTYLSSIHLYDLSGKSLYSEIINESDHHTYVKTLDLSNYATGIYLLQLVNNNSVITKKVVLR